MNQVREIVTKAVVAKGKKNVRIDAKILGNEPIYSILGCIVINNKFDAKRENFDIYIDGSFELNVWYSTMNNSQTEILKQVVYYKENVKTKQIINDFVSRDDDIIVKVDSHPSCQDVKINDNEVNVTIEFELAVDVIGETKIQISILDNVEVFLDDDEDFTSQINQNYIGKK